MGLALQERAFAAEEACAAAEVSFTSVADFVVPAVSIDGRRIGTG
jgi:D-alanine transaminase